MSPIIAPTSYDRVNSNKHQPSTVRCLIPIINPALRRANSSDKTLCHTIVKHHPSNSEGPDPYPKSFYITIPTTAKTTNPHKAVPTSKLSPAASPVCWIGETGDEEAGGGV